MLATPAIAAGPAEWKPSKPVELVVGAGPAGGNDRIARMLQKLIADMGLVSTTVLVVNKPGAGGAVGQTYINSHPNDGHYLMMQNPALISNPLVGIGRAVYTDITPIAQLLADYVVMVGAADGPLKTSADLLKSLKTDPGRLNIAVSPGYGAGPHLAIAMLAQAVGVDPAKLHVAPYNGSAEAVTAVLGGQIDLLPSTAENVAALVASGRLQAYGVTAPGRLTGQLSSVPTWREQGIDVVYNNWRAIVGPKRMPAGAVLFWENVFSQISGSSAWKTLVTNAFLVPDYQDGTAFGHTLTTENATVKATLATLGLLKGT